jgi:sugar phosphate permease
MTCQNFGSILGQQISSLLLITFQLRWEYGFLLGSYLIIQTGFIQYFYLSAKPDIEFELNNISVDISVRQERTIQMNELQNSVVIASNNQDFNNNQLK